MAKRSNYRQRYSHSSSSYKPRSVRVFERKSRHKLIWTIVISLALIYLAIFWIIPAIISNISSLRGKPVSNTAVAISEDATLAPPVLNIPFEATNTGTINITGYAAPNSKIELYVDDVLQKDTAADSNGNFSFDNITLNLGTDTIYGKTVSSDQKTSLPSKPIRLLYSIDKPKLDVTEPEDNKIITGGDKKIRIAGQTDPDNNLTINGSIQIVNGDGHFSTEKDLAEGDNQFVISATNKVGNTTQISKKVTYHP